MPETDITKLMTMLIEAEIAFTVDTTPLESNRSLLAHQTDIVIYFVCDRASGKLKYVGSFGRQKVKP